MYNLSKYQMQYHEDEYGNKSPVMTRYVNNDEVRPADGAFLIELPHLIVVSHA